MGLHSITSFSSIDYSSPSSIVEEVLDGCMDTCNSQHTSQLYGFSSKFGQWHFSKFLGHIYEKHGCTLFLLFPVPPGGIQMLQREFAQPFWATRSRLGIEDSRAIRWKESGSLKIMEPPYQPGTDCYFEFLCHSIRIQSLTYNLRDKNIHKSYVPPHPSGSQVLSHYHLSFLFFSTHCHCADPSHLHLTPIPLQVLPGQPLCYSHPAIQSKALFLKCTAELDQCPVSSAVSFFLFSPSVAPCSQQSELHSSIV